MSETSRPRLLIAAHYEWMKPYVQASVRCLWTPGSRLVIALHDPRAAADFDWLPAEALTVVAYPQGFFSGKGFLIHPRRLIRAIDEAIEAVDPEAVYSLSMDLPLWRYLPRLQERRHVVYAVHDVVEHERTPGSLYQRLYLHLFHALPIRRLVARMRRQTVNARWQERWLREHYPDHEVTYEEFPSLVTPEIATGTAVPPEVADERGYLLFFGSVERYKGVERLLDMYSRTPALQGRKVVIAGRGHLAKTIPKNVADKVIRIDRFIPDEELGELFRRSAAVVYPYLSATQSGVLSIASWFGRPMVLSNVDYFVETAEGFEGVEIVDTSDYAAFAAAVARAAEGDADTRGLYEARYR